MKNRTARQMLITLVPSVTLLAAMASVHLFFRVSLFDMTLDATEVLHLHPLYGFLTNLGVLLWTAAATVCFFAAFSLRHLHSREIFRFLLCSALLSTYLTFDDLFRIHEWLAYRYLGITEKFVVMMLAAATAGYLVAFRRLILRTHFSVFAAAFGLLSFSVVLDEIPERWIGTPGEWMNFLEDGAKWLGIACWCSYFVRTSFQLFTEAIQSGGAQRFRRQHSADTDSLAAVRMTLQA